MKNGVLGVYAQEVVGWKVFVLTNIGQENVTVNIYIRTVLAFPRNIRIAAQERLVYVSWNQTIFQLSNILNHCKNKNSGQKYLREISKNNNNTAHF